MEVGRVRAGVRLCATAMHIHMQIASQLLAGERISSQCCRFWECIARVLEAPCERPIS